MAARDIDEVIGQRRDGTKITVLDRAVESTRLGVHVRLVAARIGTTTATLYEWERTGARVNIEVEAGRRRVRDLSKFERKCKRWTDAMLAAEAEGQTFLLGLLERNARGYETTKVTETVDRQGNIISRRTETAQTGPDTRALTWLLARRWPAEFGDRVSMEVSGPAGGPVLIDSQTPAIDRLNAELDALVAQTAEADQLLEGHAGP